LRTANKLLCTLSTEVLVTSGLQWEVDVEVVLTPVRVPSDYIMVVISDRATLHLVITHTLE
jgi:hypothetical protein